MEDRIKINDVWYVKEESKKEDIEIDLPMAFFHTKSILWENDKYSIKATMYNLEYPNDIKSECPISIKLTNKKDNKEEDIDYLPYIKNLAKRDNESLINLTKSTEHDLEELQILYLLIFIDYLVEVKWIKL